MQTCKLIPDSAGYTAEQANNTVNSGPLAGGPSRSRVDIIGGSGKATASWTSGPAGYDYLMAFYRTATNFGADPFIINMILDSSAILPYTVKFTSMPKLSGQKGHSYTTSCELEVYPQPVNNAADQTIIDNFNPNQDTDGMGNLSVSATISTLPVGSQPTVNTLQNGNNVVLQFGFPVSVVQQPVNVVQANNSPIFNLSQGSTQRIVLNQDATQPSFSNPADGQEYTIFIRQPASGGKQFFWPAQVVGLMDISNANANNAANSVAMAKITYDSVSGKFFGSLTYV